MKKIVAALLCAALLCLLLAGCEIDETGQNMVFTGVIEEIHENSILVSTADEVGFDKASVGFSPDLKLSFNLIVGQRVKITILPQIRESYPVQVTAVMIELAGEPAEPGTQPVGYATTFYRADQFTDGGWDFLIQEAANPDAMLISSRRHIPVIAVKDADSLAAFLEAGKEYYQFDVSYGEFGKFADTAKKYDEAFFAESGLLILGMQEPSGSIRHSVKEIAVTKDTLSVVVETTVPEMGTDDMADWFAVVELKKEDMEAYAHLDAYYG